MQESPLWVIFLLSPSHPPSPSLVIMTMRRGVWGEEGAVVGVWVCGSRGVVALLVSLCCVRAVVCVCGCGWLCVVVCEWGWGRCVRVCVCVCVCVCECVCVSVCT